MSNNNQSKKLCKNMLQYGACRNDKCEFVHDMNQQLQPQQSIISPLAGNSKIISPQVSTNIQQHQIKKTSSPILPPNSMDPLITSFQNTSMWNQQPLYNDHEVDSQHQQVNSVGNQQQQQHHWTDNIVNGINEYVPKSFYYNQNANQPNIDQQDSHYQSNINTPQPQQPQPTPQNYQQYLLMQQQQQQQQQQQMKQFQQLKPSAQITPPPPQSNIKLQQSPSPPLQQQQQQQPQQPLTAQQIQQLQQPFNPYFTQQSQNRFKPGRRVLASFFMSESLKQDLQNRKVLLYETLDPNDPRTKNIPPMLNKYHSLFPLDLDYTSRENQGKMFGYGTSVYKAISTFDGLPYAIRRVEGFRLSSEFALQAADTWRTIQHPSIVPLKEIFVSKEFGDNSSIFFSYEFFPGSETLESRFLSPTSQQQQQQQQQPIKESVLWSFICQIVSALKTIHSNQLVCRVIHPSKILLTGKNRIRINGVGIFDVVNFDTPRNLAQYQHEDLLLFGRLILTLACRSSASTTAQNLSKSIDYLSNHYSKELYNLVYLLMKPQPVNQPTIDDVVTMIAGRLLQENNNLHQYTDDLESELYKEFENGRLFRLLSKLGFINERPMYDMDQRWSETGDRYLIKLFRDYLFHQVYEDGTPVLDYYHVVESLNKLDAGVDEKILLMSRDEQSILVVSYKDMKKCIESAFNELLVQKSVHNQQGLM